MRHHRPPAHWEGDVPLIGASLSPLPMHLDVPSSQGPSCRIATARLNAEGVTSGPRFGDIGHIDPVGGRHAIDGRVPEEGRGPPTAREGRLHEGGHIDAFDEGSWLSRQIDDGALPREPVNCTPCIEAKRHFVAGRLVPTDTAAAWSLIRRSQTASRGESRAHVDAARTPQERLRG